jgi:Zn-dependent metalloprotease
VKRTLLLGGLSATMLVASALAAAPSGARPQDPGASHVSSASAAAHSAAALIRAKAPSLHVGSHDGFVALPVVSGGNGLQYAPYLRTYDGLPVVGGDFVVVTDSAGRVIATSAAQTRAVSLGSTRPTFAASRATAIARHQLGRVSSTDAASLVVVQGAKSHLAWATRVTGVNAGRPSSKSVYVDALTGKVLRTQEHVLFGTGDSAYNGPNPITLNTTLSGGTYRLQDPATPSRVCQDAANNTTFSGADDAWGNGNATNQETGCVDAFWATQVEKSMLTAWLGRNGMDGNGGWVPTRVGLNDLNAYYDGTQVQVGHNSANGWISSMDVVGHEYGHGVDDKTPGGISRNGTQEFVADVFGALTEAYAAEPSPYDVPDFLVGEEINLVGSGPIRNMYDPSQLGDANCYSRQIAHAEVHSAAGPGNHWFYLLSQGSNPSGGPVSPTCNGSTVTGLGIQQAGKIFYNAMLMKTSTSSYPKYRVWTLTSSKALYGTAACNTVKAAWNAISVPAQKGEPAC